MWGCDSGGWMGTSYGSFYSHVVLSVVQYGWSVACYGCVAFA